MGIAIACTHSYAYTHGVAMTYTPWCSNAIATHGVAMAYKP